MTGTLVKHVASISTGSVVRIDSHGLVVVEWTTGSLAGTTGSHAPANVTEVMSTEKKKIYATISEGSKSLLRARVLGAGGDLTIKGPRAVITVPDEACRSWL